MVRFISGCVIPAVPTHATTLHIGGTIVLGLPFDTLVGIVLVPAIISLALLVWALKW